MSGPASPWATGMKHFQMKQQRDKPAKARKSSPRSSKPTETAFDLWLQRGLHKLFDDVAHEPIPEELLKLIEEDRGK